MVNKPDDSSVIQKHELKRETWPLPSTWAAGSARPLPAIVRAHLVEARQEQESVQAAVMRREGRPQQDQNWPDLVLAFDTETTTDEFASLRFGTYIVEWFNPLLREIERFDAGFFAGESLSKAERQFMEAYCKAHGLTCMTRREWLDKVFFVYGYYAYGAVVGFNLPFDLSRIATRAGIIRLPEPTEKYPKPNYIVEQFAGGTYLVLNEREKKDEPGQWRERAYRPSVWIKPINPRASMYRWGFFKNWREKSDKFYAGHFLNLRTLGLALSKDEEKNGDLRSFGKRFGAQVLKTENREHSGPLAEAYLDYAMNDAEATLALYHAEMDEYRRHGLSVKPDRIYSGASLGKAYLKMMGLQAPPMLDTSESPYSLDEVSGFAMSAYYSGRSEAHIVNVSVPVIYLDYHSMYPAVCIRQGLWELMKAEQVKVTDVTQETIGFLENVEQEDLYKPETWKRLNVLCLVEPEEDVLPVRADFLPRKQPASKLSHRIALSEVASAREPMWWALADCVNSKLLTDKPPRIIKALKFSAGESRTLKPVSIRGGVTIDPNIEDFFRALVEARDALGEEDRKLADALKIVANSTSYGIWAELDIEDGARPVTAYSTERRQAIIPHGEKPGCYYFPPFATFITSGARLMLSLLESEFELRGSVSAFCDTDSLAVVSSKDGGVLSFRDHRGATREIPVLTWDQVDGVLHKSESLNPYHSGKPLIKLEPENFEDKDPSQPRVNLHAYVIAAKRYALYVPPDRKVVRSWPTIMKASYHTLGIVEPPRDENGNEAAGWIEELWRHIVTGRPFSPSWVQQPVEFRLDISRPEIRRGFRKLRSKACIDTGNKWMNNYLAGVKPFNSVAVLAKSQDKFSMNKLESDKLKDVPVIAPVGWGGKTDTRRWTAKNNGTPVYILPPEEVISRASRMSDEELEKELETRCRARQEITKKIEREGSLFTTYMTFAELMADYQGHHENKALDAYGTETDRDTRGLLSRPRVRITELDFIGKETVLQEEVERGIVSLEEAESQRFIIPPNGDPDAELVIEALCLLSNTELKRFKISWRMADRIKSTEGPLALNGPSLQSELVTALIEYLREQYPEEVGDLEGEAALRAFVRNHKGLLEGWEAIQPRLAELSTKELAQIAGCSRREAVRIKRGEVKPKLEVMRRIVKAFSPDGYNSVGV